ncbi:MAG: DUF4381 domain-containing protein [Gammaproteobacteria bacterium]|nr:DUF4381 domain-containing protein [Gammaproteobacteria bacterium]
MNPGWPADALAALRGYREPAAIPLWPPAPGWWLLVALLLALVVALAWRWRRRHRQTAASRVARDELARLRRQFASGHDAARYVRGLSTLLRRYALAVFPRHRVAALTGDDWLGFLDRHGGRGRFVNGPGRRLVDAPYRPDPDVQPEVLAALVEDWIRRNGRART